MDPWSAIILSLQVATLATLLTLPPGTAMGWLLARREFRGKTLVGTLAMAPLVLPPVVTGFLLLRMLSPHAPVGQALKAMGIQIPFTLLGAALAAAVVGFPLVVLSARSAFSMVDHRMAELSLTLGVPPRTTFWRITLPMARPGLAAGAVLAYARALGEFGATTVLAGNVEGETRTIALGVYTLLERPGETPEMTVLVGASIALSLGAIAGWEWLHRRMQAQAGSHR
jgi:molybdate transport system permease protein